MCTVSAVHSAAAAAADDVMTSVCVSGCNESEAGAQPSSTLQFTSFAL